MKGHTHPGLMYARRIVEKSLFSRFPATANVTVIGGDPRRYHLYPVHVTEPHVCYPDFAPEAQRKWADWASWARTNRQKLDFCRGSGFHPLTVNGEQRPADYVICYVSPELWPPSFTHQVLEQIVDGTQFYLLDYYAHGRALNVLPGDAHSSNVVSEVQWNRDLHIIRFGDTEQPMHEFPWRRLRAGSFSLHDRCFRATVQAAWGTVSFGWALLVLDPGVLAPVVEEKVEDAPPVQDDEGMSEYAWSGAATWRFWKWSSWIGWRTKHQARLPRKVVAHVLALTLGSRRDESSYGQICANARTLLLRHAPELDDELDQYTRQIASLAMSRLPQEAALLSTFQSTWFHRQWAVSALSTPLWVPTTAFIVAVCILYGYLRHRCRVLPPRPAVRVMGEDGGVVLAENLAPLAPFVGVIAHAPMAYLSKCFRGKTTKALHSQSFVKPPLQARCIPRYESVQCGPVPNISRCYTNRACTHNEISGLTDRVCAEKSPCQSQLWETLSSLVTAFATHRVERASLESWLGRFKVVKRASLLAAFADTHGVEISDKDYDSLSFVKREHNPLFGLDAYCDEEVPYKAPRIIQGSTRALETLHGRQAHDFTRNLAANFSSDGPMLYAWGMTSELIGEWYDHNLASNWVGGELDFVRQDKEERYCNLVGFDGTLYQSFGLDMPRDVLINLSVCRGKSTTGVKYRGSGMRSGRHDTHGANSGKTGAVLLYSARTWCADGFAVRAESRESLESTKKFCACFGGDDSAYMHPRSVRGYHDHLVSVAAEAGFPSKGKQCELDQMSFYSSRFWPHEDGTLLTGLLGRHWLKAYLAVTHWKIEKDLRKWAHATALCHLKAYHHVPGVDVLHRKMLSLTQFGEEAGPRKQYSFERAHSKTQRQYEHVVQVYSTSVDAIVDFERLVDSIRTPYCSIDHPFLRTLVSHDVASSPTVGEVVNELWGPISRRLAPWVYWVLGSVTMTLPKFYMCVGAPVFEEGAKRLHWLFPTVLSLLEAFEHRAELSINWRVYLFQRIVNLMLHNFWARLPYGIGVILHAANNFMAVFANPHQIAESWADTNLPSTPGMLGYRKVLPRSAVTVRQQPAEMSQNRKNRSRAYAAANAEKAAKSPQPVVEVPAPRLERKENSRRGEAIRVEEPRNPRRGRPMRERPRRAPAQNAPRSVQLAKVEQPKPRQPAARPMADPLGQASVTALRNALGFFDALANPSTRSAARFPDGTAPTVTAEQRFTIALPTVQDSVDTTRYRGGLIVRPSIERNWDLATAFASDVPTWGTQGDNPKETEYAANFRTYRVTALSLKIHDTAPLTARSAFVQCGLLPDNVLPSTAVGPLLAQVPRIEFESSAEHDIADQPEECIWQPYLYGGLSFGAAGDAFATGLTLREIASSGFQNDLRDQVLCVYVDSTATGSNIEVEVYMHFEFVPLPTTIDMFQPRMTIGNLGAVGEVASAIAMTNVDDNGANRPFKQAVAKVKKESEGFWAKAGRVLKKGLEWGSKIVETGSMVAGLFGHAAPARFLPADEKLRLHAYHLNCILNGQPSPLVHVQAWRLYWEQDEGPSAPAMLAAIALNEAEPSDDGSIRRASTGKVHAVRDMYKLADQRSPRV